MGDLDGRVALVRSGRYAPVVSAVAEGLRLDILAVESGPNPDGGGPGLRVDFALWGVPRFDLLQAEIHLYKSGADHLAEAEGGCLLMDLDAATAGYGLAAPSGTFFDTGIGGLTLGGGISHIIASEGLRTRPPLSGGLRCPLSRP